MISPTGAFLLLIAWVLLGSSLAIAFLALTLRIAALLGELWDWLGWRATRRPRSARRRPIGGTAPAAGGSTP